MMRRLIDTECRQVYELQHKHNSAQRDKLLSEPARPGAKEKRGSGVSPDCDMTQHTHANNKPSAVELSKIQHA